MKKTLVSALTTALVVGAASTTFAAANPFSDVPADHWAYDAVSQLAADGVIEGYGDSTFRGDRNITRYEMAQMVARAMAKNDVSAATKAMIDKLAAEFADELNSLGVRVANLERNADMVKWNGKLEYTFTSTKQGVNANRVKNNNLLFRLEPSAEVNDHWHVNARLDGNYNMNQDQGNTARLAAGAGNNNEADVRLRRAWAQGDYKLFSVRFGRFGMYGADTIHDANMSGLDVTIGNKNKLSGTLGYGRTSDTDFGRDNFGNALKVFYAGVDYNKNENKGFFGGVQYYRYQTQRGNWVLNDNKNNIWQVNAGYKFDKNSTLRGMYAHSDLDNVVSGHKKAYNVEFDYKGAQKENKGTWGAWLAYRHLGVAATPAETWDVTAQGYKGWAIGANYAVMKNIVATLQYGDNKFINNTRNKYKEFFGRVEWFF